MSIATEISRIVSNIAAAYAALSSKGATMPASQTSDNLAEAISSIIIGETVDLTAATASEGDVISGKTFYSKDKTLKTGTLPDYPARETAKEVVIAGDALYYVFPYGNRKLDHQNSDRTAAGETLVKAPRATVASAIGLTAAKIVKGNTILGIAGTAPPDGLTITPVNDVGIWQKCAGLSTTYTTVAQVLADTATLKTLINNANAMEYLIRSTTIQATVLANSTAVGYLDKSAPVITPSIRRYIASIITIELVSPEERT